MINESAVQIRSGPQNHFCLCRW